MTEGLLETLQILAYLSIALISLVVATYAISVSYLGRETHRSLWRKKKRRAELERKIKELGEKADVKRIKEEIETYEKEISELDKRLFYLSVEGAVVLPSILGLIALVFTIYNIYMNPSEIIRHYLMLGAVIFIAAGFVFLVKTLFTIDWVASGIPIPEFEVAFESRLFSEKFHSKERKEVTFVVANIGEVIAEDIEVFFFFPPEFKVGSSRYYRVTKQEVKEEYPNHNAVTFDIKRIHIDVGHVLPRIALEMPEKMGSYIIPVGIYERKIGESKHKLTLEIVS